MKLIKLDNWLAKATGDDVAYWRALPQETRDFANKIKGLRDKGYSVVGLEVKVGLPEANSNLPTTIRINEWSQ